MEYIVDFVGIIEAENWKDAKNKINCIMENLDKFFKSYDLGLETNEGDDLCED